MPACKFHRPLPPSSHPPQAILHQSLSRPCLRRNTPKRLGAGSDLAGRLTDLGLIDEYRLYFRPFVLGRGKPYFAGARPPLRPVATHLVGEDAGRITEQFT